MAQRASAPGILIVVEPPGTAWPHVDTLVRELSALGAEVAVAAVTPLRPGQRLEYSSIPGVELLPCPSPAASPAEHLAKRTRIADWLLSVEDLFNPDVVHLTGYLHAGLPWCGKLLVAGHPGSGSAYGRLDDDQRKVCRAAFLHGLKGADLVVTPTRSMMAALNRHFGDLPGRVIRDGRDPGRYTPFRKEPVVLSAGPQRVESGSPSTLERAASAIAWPVVVAGEQVDASGRPVRLQGVSALGRVLPGQLVPWFNRASVYAAMSTEGAGAFTAEAGMAGCALVLGDTPALREMWSGAALFVGPDDAEAMAAGMRSLMADRRLLEAMGHAARRRALPHTGRAMAEAYLSAYRDLIAGRAADQFAEEGRPTQGA